MFLFRLLGGGDILDWWEVALRLANDPMSRVVCDLIHVSEILFFEW